MLGLGGISKANYTEASKKGLRGPLSKELSQAMEGIRHRGQYVGFEFLASNLLESVFHQNGNNCTAI